MMTGSWMMQALAIGLVGIAVAGCVGAGNVPADPLDGTSWLLVSLENADPLPEIAISVAFDAGSVHGSSGCNSFGASYRTDGDAIEIREIESTLRACAEPAEAMGQEQRFIALLHSAERYQITDGQLRLMSSDRELLAFVPHE